MAVTKPRTRLVNFRVSKEEFIQLHKDTKKSGARSLSDHVRTRILGLKGIEDASSLRQLRKDMEQLHEKFDLMVEVLTNLADIKSLVTRTFQPEVVTDDLAH